MEKRQRIENKERDEWSGVAEFLVILQRNIWRLANCKEKTLNGLTILIYDVKLFVGTNGMTS